MHKNKQAVLLLSGQCIVIFIEGISLDSYTVRLCVLMQAFANPEDARAFSPKKDDKAI